MGDCYNNAIKYATRYGWAVFPVSPRTKKPLTPHGCKDAKKDVGAITAWWTRWPDAAIGVATGSPSNLIVIDEDLDDNKGIDGIMAVREWENVNGEFPETVSAITGRGGYHLYFKYEGSDIGNRAGILEGVDVRGEGGYVVAPPSLHPNGTEYAWEYDPEDTELAEIDDTVKSFLKIGKEEHGETFSLPDTIPSGARNDTLYRLACSLQAQGLPDAAIQAAVMAANTERCDSPLSADEIELLVGSALRYKKGELKVLNTGIEWHEPELKRKTDKDGNVLDMPLQTIANAEEAITFDKDLFGRIRYNVLAYSPYVYGNLPWKSHKGWREWSNSDDTNLKSYIEDKYHLKNGEKIMDALTNVYSKAPFNPVIEMLEDCHENWDGNKYIENLLPMFLGCEKSEYTTAVMRLFMLGAISRIYKPGCKFDYMLVLVGPQGKFKSSFLRFLAMSDTWFNDNFSTLDSGKAVENLRGMWIVELAELQATKRAKDVETIKAFITSRSDIYRAPYGRRTEQRPRMCVLAGTSNPTDFLTDRTGNRRFLPITTYKTEPTRKMFDDEIATKAIFAQAWGEAMDEYKRAGGNVKLVLPDHLQKQALDSQTAYLEEDPKIGIIQEWLDNTDKPRVCVMMIWREALKHEYDEPKPSEVNQLHDIMRNSVNGWKYVGIQRCGGMYGNQRSYERIDDFLTVNDEETPFC